MGELSDLAPTDEWIEPEDCECGECAGSGDVECGICCGDGSAERPCPECRPDGDDIGDEPGCIICEGSGVTGADCDACGGTGLEECPVARHEPPAFPPPRQRLAKRGAKACAALPGRAAVQDALRLL